MLLEILESPQENTCARVSFLIKLPETLCFLRNLFYGTSPDDCFLNKLNSISRGICLAFKSRQLELFCKLIIQLFSGVMVKRSTLQLYRTIIFLAQLLMAASNHLIDKRNQNIRQVKNQIIKRQIPKKN